MIFPTKTKLKKGKSVKAVAQFSSNIPSKGAIATADCHNVQLTNGLACGGAFVQNDGGVLQYMPGIDGQPSKLTLTGLTVGGKTFNQLANSTKVRWAFEGSKNALVVCNDNTTYCIEKNFSSKIFAESFDSLAFCQSRLFALKGNRVYLSLPTCCDFQENLWVDLPTKCVALVNNGHLYAIGNDVYKIQPDGEESHIEVSKICSNVGSVSGDTIYAYGNKIIFVADGKIVYLQHGSIKEVAKVDVAPTFATMHRGLYYLFGKRLGENVAIAYNPHSGKMLQMYHVNAQNAYSDGYQLYVSDGTNGYLLTDESKPSYWKSLPINFDESYTTKFLHRLVIQTSTDVQVHVVSDAIRIYQLKGKDSAQSLLIAGHGKNITIEVHCNGEMDVPVLSITARTSEVSV